MIYDYETASTLSGRTKWLLTDEETLLMGFDAEKLRQVVVNLLSNAVKFTPEGGDVYLHLDRIREMYWVSPSAWREKMQVEPPNFPMQHLTH